MALATIPLSGVLMGMEGAPESLATTETVQTNLALVSGIEAATSIINKLSAAHFAARQARFSADMAIRQSEYAMQNGLTAAIEDVAEGRKIKARQRVAIAGRGLDVGAEGTVQELAEETELIQVENARRSIKNATLQAYGFQVQADQAELQARTAEIEAVTGSASTILSSVGAFERRKAARTAITEG